MQTYAEPLSPIEMIPDQTLMSLGTDCPIREHGCLSAEDVAVLVMILPDLCGELITRRILHNADGIRTIDPVGMDVLRLLSKDSPLRQRGELSAFDTATLAANLPAICAELMARRALDLDVPVGRVAA